MRRTEHTELEVILNVKTTKYLFTLAKCRLEKKKKEQNYLIDVNQPLKYLVMKK